VIEASGRTQIVVNGWHHSGGYDFVSGRELWRLKGGGDIPRANTRLCERG
jgi:hypothetical protein